MTTTTFSCAPDNTSDATFRSWVSSLITALTTVGLVQTADTGQINPATVTRPTTASTAAGYAIFRFADTAQSSKPIFLKVEFGTGVNATVASSAPALWLTVGKSTNGAGVVAADLLPRRMFGSTAAAVGSATALAGVASAGEGWCALIPWHGFSGTNIPLGWFIIERSADGNGVAITLPVTSNGSGVLASTNTPSTLPVLWVVNYTTGAVNWGQIPVTVPYSVNGATLGGSTALAAGSVGPVFPWVALAPGLAPFQCVDALSYPGGDTPAAVFTAQIGGVTRTYYPVPLSDNHNAFGVATRPADPTSQTAAISRYVGLAIRWE